jgi:molybdenum cofactor guanylyltransferase
MPAVPRPHPEHLLREHITGLVLAGGLGLRMGGVDKGLQHYRGQPLAQHALARLAPQVGAVMISANRNLDAYRAWGVEVYADAALGEPASLVGTSPVGTSLNYAGPLAGFLTGLQQARTAYVLTVPCDTPGFPLDLATRLAAALTAAQADLAIACTPSPTGNTRQPVFCLMARTLTPSLQHYLQSGGRKVGQWAAQQRSVNVVFDDAQAFFNANTPEDLALLVTRLSPSPSGRGLG